MPRVVDLHREVLGRNDRKAALLRNAFSEAGVCAINVVSSPGTGKTSLLTAVLTEMIARDLRAAALVGDCATDNDARRLADSGAPVRQIVTEGLCHLEAAMVGEHLVGWDIGALDFLFIENVGNLVCPSAYDLGEGLRVVMLSVTEGEDKPRKYPQMFDSADMAVITKLDLADACEFDEAAARASIESVRPGLEVLTTSVKRPDTVDAFVDRLVEWSG